MARWCGVTKRKPARTPLERFLGKTTVTTSGCVEWTGKRFPNRYGCVTKDRLAHRVSWELHNGLIPLGLMVLHRCDNPPCVNPAHLFLGTQTDNMRDASRKKRTWSARGELSVRARLCDEDVREIRRLAAGGALQKDIAARFVVTAKTVSVIVRRKQWGHIP